jgi:hypothetical protein
VTKKSEAGKKYRAKTRIGDTSKYEGHVCADHPKEKGVRYIANGRCIGCHREKMIAKRARKRLESEAFKATERAKQAERSARPGYKEARKLFRERPEFKAARASRGAARRARQRQATPAWADRGKLVSIYLRARELGLTVDHIVPLKGKNVSGLHVPYNLRTISLAANVAKGNRHIG